MVEQEKKADLVGETRGRLWVRNVRRFLDCVGGPILWAAFFLFVFAFLRGFNCGGVGS